MAILNCKRLRTVVMLAGGFLIAGMILEVFAHLMSVSVNLVLLQPLALGMVLASPVIILVTVVLSLVPGVSLRDCTH
ncbi:MAG: hypothetical protein ABW076_04050 [Candidatus Thiodiazotropha sp.]